MTDLNFRPIFFPKKAPQVFNKLQYLQKMTSLTCDYLVVGGGASGMAFVDELIHHSKHLTVVMVDRCLSNKPSF